MEPDLRELLSEAQADPNAVGLVLFGSAAAGSAHEESDFDVWYVVRTDAPPPRSRHGRLELIPTNLAQLRQAPDWLKPALAYAKVLWDPTGEIEPILTAAQTVTREETAELYDAYLNDFYRSLKAWRRGLELRASPPPAANATSTTRGTATSTACSCSSSVATPNRRRTAASELSMSATRVDLVREGARATRAEVGPFEIQLLTFAPSHRIAPFDVERPYLVVVLDGSVAKGFGRVRWSLSQDSFATMPVGAAHTSDFGLRPTKVLAVRSRDGDTAPFGALLDRLRHVRAAASTTISWRIAAELRATDASWPLAAEGLVLQLLSAAGRTEPRTPLRACWLREARELLHERVPEAATLSEVATVVGVHPSHLARAFRHEYGTTVGAYSRALRLEWALTQLALNDASLADIATGAGFADQSHFTRAFRAYAGVTPGRYRELVRR